MAEKKTLLKRYEIPLNHLDFAYVKKCTDAKEMERIVHILQSGEEGYFPDLTKCAEDKLRQLKPNSRLFRCEEQLRRRADVNANEVQPIFEFSKIVRDRDQRLAACADSLDDLPPLRQAGTIKLNAKDNKNKDSDEKTVVKSPQETEKSNTKRISSTDYRKWDEYDPDVEILRMDLAEERVQEEVERKNRLNVTKYKAVPLISEIKQEEDRLKKLTDIELDTLAEEHRLRGNDYYRSKDYMEALAEYTRAIAINPEREAAAYNNRALTNIKLKNYQEAIEDCEKCLSIEPNNVKAMYRLAESNMHCGFKEKALELFSKVLQLDTSNVNAKNSIEYLRSQIGEQPPANATRLKIAEDPFSSKKSNQTNQNAKNSTNASAIKTLRSKTEKTESAKDYDLSALIRPKEIVPNKVLDNAANMFTKAKPPNPNENYNAKQMQTKPTKDVVEDTFKLRLPSSSMDQNSNLKRDKPLIQEI